MESLHGIKQSWNPFQNAIFRSDPIRSMFRGNLIKQTLCKVIPTTSAVSMKQSRHRLMPKIVYGLPPSNLIILRRSVWSRGARDWQSDSEPTIADIAKAEADPGDKCEYSRKLPDDSQDNLDDATKQQLLVLAFGQAAIFFWTLAVWVSLVVIHLQST